MTPLARILVTVLLALPPTAAAADELRCQSSSAVPGVFAQVCADQGSVWVRCTATLGDTTFSCFG